MKAATLKYWILSKTATLVMVLLALMPFHAFITVWLASGIDHYTLLRLWKEILLVVIGLGVLYLCLTDQHIRSHTFSRRLVWIIFGYIGIQLIWGIGAYEFHHVTLKALGYGLIINLRPFVIFLFAWAVALRTQRLRSAWIKLVLWPAAIVITFGLLQALVLPNDFLRHFGYGPATIPAFETINHNQAYIRVASTLRGANPLGAYLLIPVSVYGVLLARELRNWRRILGLVTSLACLFFTFSRSAWLGAIVTLGVVTLLQGRVMARRAGYVAAGLFVALLLVFVGLRHNGRFENLVFHTESHSAIKTTSDQGHASALRDGLYDVAHHPLGYGVGTAGPASVYNGCSTARIAENYFIQIGQETGWLGLGFFIVINSAVGYLLWLRRKDTLAASLLASLIGITFVNLLSHAWADDTLAYVWWGLAGIAMAPIPNLRGAKVVKAKPSKT